MSKVKPLCPHGLLKTYCIECKRQWHANWRARNPEKVKQYQNTYSAKNPERRNAQKIAATKRWWSKRGTYERYGITETQFRELMAYQNGLCAICLKPMEQDRKGVHIDHDGSQEPKGWRLAENPRGLLCFNCNIGLGKFSDDPDRLARAISYLAEPPFLRATRENRITSREEAT